ncbi:MAG: hypothetical protein FWG64_02025 [Firmicutes bacterium]|nr:hypothetical protein [Bacillota bacterium]
MNNFETDSLNVFQLDGVNKALLKKNYGVMLSNYQRDIISPAMENVKTGGTLRAGMTTHARYASSVSQPYGTGREKQRGEAIREHRVSVGIKDRREFMHEIEEFDLRTMPDFFKQMKTTMSLDHLSADRQAVKQWHANVKWTFSKRHVMQVHDLPQPKPIPTGNWSNLF